MPLEHNTDSLALSVVLRPLEGPTINGCFTSAFISALNTLPYLPLFLPLIPILLKSQIKYLFLWNCFLVDPCGGFKQVCKYFKSPPVKSACFVTASTNRKQWMWMRHYVSCEFRS